MIRFTVLLIHFDLCKETFINIFSVVNLVTIK